MKIQDLSTFNAATINAMSERAQDAVRAGRKQVIDDLKEYQRLVGCGIRDFTIAARRKYQFSLKALRYEEELAMDLSIIASIWNTTRFNMVKYSINDGEDIYDYIAYFLSDSERKKFERENRENGADFIVLISWQCGIDDLPIDVRKDFIEELFSEWV